MRRLALALLAGALAASGPASALTEHALSTVGATPRVGERLPLDLAFRDDLGRPTTLGQALGGKPAVLIFADYRCTSLCGPGLVLTALALDHTDLRPGRDYRFVVVGLDAADPPAVAAAVRQNRLQSRAGRAAVLLGGGQADRVAAAAGYRYLFDPKIGQYVHDTVVYALDRDGRVREALSEFTLDPAVLKRALSDAPTPAGVLLEQVRLLCHGLVADTGLWNRPVTTSLRVGGVATLALMALAAGALAVRRRRAR